MGNTFDSYRRSAIDKVTSIMGESASWSPIAGGGSLTAEVLFNSPNVEVEVEDSFTHHPLNPTMEWREPFFPGLYESVRSGESGEIVSINGTDYKVKDVVKLHDGNTYMAELFEV